MIWHRDSRTPVQRLLALALWICVGCGPQNTVESYTPPELSAREALERALTAWKNGQEKPGIVSGSNPEIRVADQRWQQGVKLKDFEIGAALEEEDDVKFPVKLTLDNATAPEEETYIVVGKNPLWVWTAAEYERNSGM
ncbi:MAG: hypothetical protein JSS02_17785 [Planctomycetes bacterium]|nr:hypothetical protein [Planctomycetota bacterium]